MSARTVRSAIALGSNLGDRARHLALAVREIGHTEGVRVVAVSRWIETDPVGGPPNQGRYLNGAVLVETTLSARDLLRELQRIEHEHGRDRSVSVQNGPRTLDLDLLTHGLERHADPSLCVPHPRMFVREFVLAPLAEIAPDLVVPGTPPRTVRELLVELESGSQRPKSDLPCGVETHSARG